MDLSNDVLRFARVKDLELATASLAAVIDEMVSFFGPTARQANIEIKSYLPADLPPVALDLEMFKQALLNLMLNAHQAMPSGGELTIQATLECDGERPGQVCINFIDTGQGISRELLGRVFRPFFSTRPEGTGLGLATTRKIVEAHGGTIDVQSELDRGTKFTIRLPACSEKPSSASA